jgi:hypothetical protein
MMWRSHSHVEIQQIGLETDRYVAEAKNASDAAYHATLALPYGQFVVWQ